MYLSMGLTLCARGAAMFAAPLPRRGILGAVVRPYTHTSLQ